MDRIVANTPITELCGYEETGNRFFMKRDDLQPFAFGGNKVRIAAAFFADMKAQGCDAMLMYGDLRSNLCRVLALLCKSEHVPARMIGTSENTGKLSSNGISEIEQTLSSDGESENLKRPSVGLPDKFSLSENLRGTPSACTAGVSERRKTHAISFNERLIRLTGTEIVTCAKDKIAETVEREMDRFRAEGRRPYYIYGNKFGEGNEGCAASAYADAWNEILEWEAREGLRFDLIVTPYGTGATQAGLVSGMMKECLRTDYRDGMIQDIQSAYKTDNNQRNNYGFGCIRRIVGISISSRTRERAMKSLEDGVRGYFQRENIPLPENSMNALELHTEFNGGGYGLVDERVHAEVEKMLLSNGIGLCAMYTGKAFLGMLDLLKKENIRGKNVLFLNTGGLPIFFDDLSLV